MNRSIAATTADTSISKTAGDSFITLTDPTATVTDSCDP
jgi:hypothetical protein